MSYKVVKTSGSINRLTIRYFLCDYESDIAKLPTNTTIGEKQDWDTVSDELCGIGSIAKVVETGNKYHLNVSGKWVKTSGSDGSSGGGTTSSDYGELNNKPSINGVEISGNKTLDDYGIQSATDNDLNTKSKTIDGAINELLENLTIKEF